MKPIHIHSAHFSQGVLSPSRYEFHINRLARVKYQVDEALFESTGNVIFPNFRAVRQLAYAINAQRGVLHEPAKQVRAGVLNAFGLLDEIHHFLIRLYDEQDNKGAIQRAYRFLEKQIGKTELEKTLRTFLTEFPPKAVYTNAMTLDEYYTGNTAGRSHIYVALEEMIVLYLENQNPASKPFKELFDDKTIAESTPYYTLFAELNNFFSNEKPFGPENKPLLEALKIPMYCYPESVEAQLKYVKDKWKILLTPKFLERIESSFAFTQEEEKFIWNLMHPAGDGGDVQTFVPEYKKTQLTAEQLAELQRRGIKPEDFIYEEPERFTPDIDWMPNVVLIAKNTYVWLDQLSKKYQRCIRRLDQIPDEELDQLARWHFNGLWLIGVWERSSASKKIKQLSGNSDAVSSAYSLYDYEIAHDLGGEEAFRNVAYRAWQRGIRLAGDMVPNHMGIYSKWVIEHPEYFIQTSSPPYPNYRFTGVNLSDDPNIELRIEDGYWNRSDAAVVFQRIDKRSGEVRYIYHGNDGTHMPWNDTAQLNLLRADVREAIIQNIFHVARKFSIIRFDAAMTLAKKHFQRLWYPMPGTSGVPSRQDYSMTRAEFDALFPTEFWREVVDRINNEMPQTLLLAEAFWLMEGYFVRTLGMHRVYNSAFMHMLMKEENEKYRSLIKNTIEFNPEILKRYVNFMSNPDEKTAVEQFGKDDKYFGVAVMMVTLPGLPMFAHGQIEGFYEKYGMEYQRAYYNETPDEWLIHRHEREIFPLMQKRYLFSQVHNFEFYDFLDDRGFVNENVFAYSNRAENERALVFYHNAYAECKGYIQYSLQKAMSEGGTLRSLSLAQALNLRSDEHTFYRFRERRSNTEYLVSGKSIAERGWRMELRAYQYAVFTDFVELYDSTGGLSEIARQLDGRGTDHLEQLLALQRLRPFHKSVKELVAVASQGPRGSIEEQILAALTQLTAYTHAEFTVEKFKSEVSTFVSAAERFFNTTYSRGKKVEQASTLSFTFALLYHLLVLCKKVIENKRNHYELIEEQDIVEKLHLQQVIAGLFEHNSELAQNHIQLYSILLRIHDRMITQQVPIPTIIEYILNDFVTADFLGVNQHEDVWYFNKEQFELLMTWLFSLQFLYTHTDVTTSNPFFQEKKLFHQMCTAVNDIALRSEYKVEKLKELSVAQEFYSVRNQRIQKGSESSQVKKHRTKQTTAHMNKIIRKKPSR